MGGFRLIRSIVEFADMARTGYTLPVFAVAAAKAALLHLRQGQPAKPDRQVIVDLLPEPAHIPIEQVAALDETTALAIALSDPGDNLDLTRNTPIWAWVHLSGRQAQPLILEAGEGLGRTRDGAPAIYRYAHSLFEANLLPLIPDAQTATVRIVLPEGRQLAQRTSNEAFGILEGLALLGTSGIAQPLSTADQLEKFRRELQIKVKSSPHLVFCIGSHGQQVAEKQGIPKSAIVQTGNWIGALLVEAGLCKAQSVLLLGYHGKLIKLAGGIFNTSSHIADARLEILAAAVACHTTDVALIREVLSVETVDAAYQTLSQQGLATPVFTTLAQQVSAKAQAYIRKYADVILPIGTVLCDRQGRIIAQDAGGPELIAHHLGTQRC